MKCNLLHPKRRAVFGVFMRHDHASFTLVQKETGLRSNEVAYVLSQFIAEGVIHKDGQGYRLSQAAEMQVPFIIDSPDHLSPLPVVLVAFKRHGKILLLAREKKPYVGCWGLPGGRIRVAETIEQASVRIMKEKARATGTFQGINAVVHEHHDVGGIVHAYLLILVSMMGESVKEIAGRRWASIQELDSLTMIPSDQWMCKNKLSATTDITHEVVEEKNDTLRLKISL